MSEGVKYPPTCVRCGERLQPLELGIADVTWVQPKTTNGFRPCPEHPKALAVFRIQEETHGYPPDWPFCLNPACGRPALDSKATCGLDDCAAFVREHGQ